MRRFRGRMPSPVSVWTAERAGRRAGWTVSSMLVADGEPAQVLGLVDEDSDLADLVTGGGPIAVSLLGGHHRGLADAFAGVTPAPGGAFRLGTWTETDVGTGAQRCDGLAGRPAERADRPGRLVASPAGRDRARRGAARTPT